MNVSYCQEEMLPVFAQFCPHNNTQLAEIFLLIYRLLKANKLSYITIVGHWSKECPRLMFSDRSGSSFRDRYSRDPYPPPPPPPPFLQDRFRVTFFITPLVNRRLILKTKINSKIN